MDNGALSPMPIMSNMPLAYRPFRVFRWILVCVAVTLTACGGGGSPNNAPTSVSGLWQDTSSSRNILAALVLDDGHYWAFFPAYGGYAAGFDHGTLSLGNLTPQYEYLNGASGSNLIHVSASYSNTGTRITGTRTRDTDQSQNTFELARMTTATYNIQNARFSGDLSGITAYTDIGNANSNNPLPFNGSASGCLYSGQLTPLSGVAAFSVHLTFATNNSCNTWSGAEANGYAVAYSVPNSSTTRLLLAVRKNNGSKGWLFTATR